MWVPGWKWYEVDDFDGHVDECTVCNLGFGDANVFYCPQDPSDEDANAVERLFGVDIFCDFTVCQRCVGHAPFSFWLEDRMRVLRLLERLHKTPIAHEMHDWAMEGF